MSKLLRIDTDYARWVEALGARFQSSRVGAALHVNREMLRFYWSLGEDMFRLQAEVRWGSGFMRNLESDLRDALPGVRGFSFTNLNYIKRFYLMFREVVPNFPQPGGKLSEDLFSIPWGHVKVLIDKFYGDSERAIYYLRKVRENNWSRAVLLNFVETNRAGGEGGLELHGGPSGSPGRSRAGPHEGPIQLRFRGDSRPLRREGTEGRPYGEHPEVSP